MKKVLSFIEWIGKHKNKINGFDNGDSVYSFYNQKFDVGMLVNPYEYKDIHLVGIKEGDENNKLWQQAEQNRLFEGWALNEDDEYECQYSEVICKVLCIEMIRKNEIVNDYYLQRINNDSYRFYTLNDFITLCNLAGIELIWNENNETIKKLFN